ncbi:hypothetical protein BGZ83_006689, partial [Gryganskiella cystojenkinii]
KQDFGYLGAIASADGPVLFQPSLLSLEDLGWIDSPNSLDAPFDSASAPAHAASLLSENDAPSGFDHLSSPLDEACASAFASPYSPYLDTPDQTPSQTPLFECVASEDFDAASLEQFWSATDAASAFTAIPASIVAAVGDFGCAGMGAVAADDAASVSTALDAFASLFPSPSTSTSSVSDADVKVESPEQATIDARLQAETALLDFVLFDDIAPQSPISTLMTPASTTLTLSPSTDSNELETQELAMQLVAAAAASMNSQSMSAQSSPAMLDSSASSNYIGSLFADVNVSPLMDTTASAPTVVSSDPQFSLDWTSTVPQTFSFDFINTINNNSAPSSTFDGRLGFDMSATASMFPPVRATSTASVDLDLLLSLSLFGQQQQEQQQQFNQSTMTSPVMAAGIVAAQTQSQISNMNNANANENPLKRKSDAIKEAGEEDATSPRQFACAQCGRAFSRLFNLNTHERTHDRSKARLFACPEQGCKKSFTRKNDLQRHQISIHGVTHIYACQKCNKPFSRKDELRRHMDLKSCQEEDGHHHE